MRPEQSPDFLMEPDPPSQALPPKMLRMGPRPFGFKDYNQEEKPSFVEVPQVPMEPARETTIEEKFLSEQRELSSLTVEESRLRDIISGKNTDAWMDLGITQERLSEIKRRIEELQQQMSNQGSISL